MYMEETDVIDDQLQLIGFTIDSECFAMEIKNVYEINRFEEIKKIPELPEHVLGIIDLRGMVIPVVNLAERIRLKNRDVTKDTRIIISEINGQKMGILVDSVSEVMRVPGKDIELPPEIIKNLSAEYIQGIFRNNGNFTIILDMERLFSNMKSLSISTKQLSDGNDKKDESSVYNRINEGIEKIVEVTRAMSEGDFHQSIEDNLYGQLGEIAKYINGALKKIQKVEPQIKLASNNIPRASMELSEITKFTEEATHNIMNQVEQVLENHNAIICRLNDMKDPENEIEEIKRTIEKDKEVLMDIFTGLSFQDLIGQKIKKIIEVIEEVEKRLLQLIITFGLKNEKGEDRMKDISDHPELNQELVDNILKEFGFD